MKIGKPEVAFLGCVIGGIVTLAIHFLFKFRQLPFLKNETVFSGGKEVPTEQFIEMMSPMFLYVTPAFIAVGFINYFILKRREQA